MKKVSNEKIYTILATQGEVTVKDLSEIMRKGEQLARTKKKEIEKYALRKYVDATDEKEKTRYNIIHLKFLPTWLVIEFFKENEDRQVEVDLSVLAKRVRDDRIAFGQQKNV